MMDHEAPEYHQCSPLGHDLQDRKTLTRMAVAGPEQLTITRSTFSFSYSHSIITVHFQRLLVAISK